MHTINFVCMVAGNLRQGLLDRNTTPWRVLSCECTKEWPPYYLNKFLYEIAIAIF